MTRKPYPRAAPVQTACTTTTAGWTNPEAVPVHQVPITTTPPWVENPEADQATRRAPDTPAGL